MDFFGHKVDPSGWFRGLSTESESAKTWSAWHITNKNSKSHVADYMRPPVLSQCSKTNAWLSLESHGVWFMLKPNKNPNKKYLPRFEEEMLYLYYPPSYQNEEPYIRLYVIQLYFNQSWITSDRRYLLGYHPMCEVIIVSVLKLISDYFLSR